MGLLVSTWMQHFNIKRSWAQRCSAAWRKDAGDSWNTHRLTMESPVFYSMGTQCTWGNNLSWGATQKWCDSNKRWHQKALSFFVEAINCMLNWGSQKEKKLNTHRMLKRYYCSRSRPQLPNYEVFRATHVGLYIFPLPGEEGRINGKTVLLSPTSRETEVSGCLPRAAFPMVLLMTDRSWDLRTLDWLITHTLSFLRINLNTWRHSTCHPRGAVPGGPGTLPWHQV